MKQSIVLPVIYLLFFIVISLFLIGLNIVIDLSDTTENSGTSGFSIIKLPTIIRDVIPIASLVSLLFIFLRILKKPGIHFFSFLLPLITAFCVLFFGIISINMVVSPVDKDISIENYIKPNKFLIFDNNILYVNSMSGNTINNAILFNNTDLFLNLNISTNMEKPVYQFIEQAQVSIADDTININKGNWSASLNIKSYYSGFYSTGKTMEYVLSGISSINIELNDFYNRNIMEFAILCFSFVFIIMASNVFMRISRWPLFNFFVVVFITIGSILLYNFLKDHIVLEFFSDISDSFFLRLIPCFCLIIIGVIFLFIDIIFIPFDFWKKEIENE